MTSDTELVERLRAHRGLGAAMSPTAATGRYAAALMDEAASAIDRLCAERDKAREGGTPEAKRLLAQIDALTKRAEEAEREVERKSQTFCAMLTTGVCDLPERLDAAESRAAALEQEVVRLGALVERAFRDGLTYATNVVVTDPDAAWQFSRARAALQAEDKP